MTCDAVVRLVLPDVSKDKLYFGQDWLVGWGIPGMGKRCYSSLQRPDLLCDLPSLPFNGYRGFLP